MSYAAGRSSHGVGPGEMRVKGGGEANDHSLVKIVGLWDDRYTMSL